MRILSQNGMIDVPYEMTAFHVAGGTIRMNMVGDTGKGTVMASYLWEGNALKAMEMLHEAYTGTIVMKDVEMSDEDKKQLQNSRGIISVISAGENVKIEPLNIVWRFPQEDEL